MTLRHFRSVEFNHWAQMDRDFLLWLDDVRDAAGVPFYLTSDYRSPERNRAAGGHPASLHPRGCAVDFATPGSRERNSQLYYRELWAITQAVAQTLTPDGRAVQLELVKGDTDWHIHLGLYPAGDPRTSKLVIATD